MKHENLQIINIFTRQDLQRLKFLCAALSKDDARPVLTYLYLDPIHNLAVAADGFKLHRAHLPECLLKYVGKLVKFLAPPKRGLNILEVEENHARATEGLCYPNFWNVVEQTEEGTPYYIFGVTTQLLEKTLKNSPHERVIFRVNGYDRPYRIEASYKTDTFKDCVAIMMPIHLEKDDVALTTLGVLETQLEEARAQLQTLEKKDLRKRIKLLHEGIGPYAALQEKEAALFRQYTELNQALIKLENEFENARKAEKANGETPHANS